MDIGTELSDEVQALLAAVAKVQTDFEAVIAKQRPDVKAAFAPVLASLTALDAAVQAASAPPVPVPAPAPA